MLLALCGLDSMLVFELFMILYLPVGTLLLNRWRSSISFYERWSRLGYIFASMLMGALPFIYLRSIEPNHSALAVILVGIAFFWFPIVGGRSENT